MSMAIRPEDLPADPARLIAMVLSLDAENDRLRAVIGTFKDTVFGSRSENWLRSSPISSPSILLGLRA
jgi:hypothetical protein